MASVVVNDWNTTTEWYIINHKVALLTDFLNEIGSRESKEPDKCPNLESRFSLTKDDVLGVWDAMFMNESKTKAIGGSGKTPKEAIDSVVQSLLSEPGMFLHSEEKEPEKCQCIDCSGGMKTIIAIFYPNTKIRFCPLCGRDITDK